MTTTDKRFVVAMSGGVDSSVAAWLLRREELSLVGLFMRNGVHVEEVESTKKSCCSAGDARDARMVAAHLGIPFQAVDLKEEFGAVIRYFIAEYGRGRTPNPCAVCNRDLKFDRLIRFARELGAEGVATGHYARLDVLGGRVRVRRGVDADKDQSYQLFAVAEENLARTRLPLGGMKKSEVRVLAREAGLKTAAKKDSQEICFVPGNDYRRLLEERKVELHPGDLVDTSGRKLGEHAGTEHFTIGQRRGHGIGGGHGVGRGRGVGGGQGIESGGGDGARSGAEPLYVVALEPDAGRVVLGSREECGARAMEVADLNWIGFDPPASGEFRCAVQHRYRGVPAAATVRVDGARAEVTFDEPEFGVTPGQGAAFYQGDLLLGGGWIDSAERTKPAAHETVPCSTREPRAP